MDLLCQTAGLAMVTNRTRAAYCADKQQDGWLQTVCGTSALIAECCCIWHWAATADRLAAQACSAWLVYRPCELCAQLAPAELRLLSGADLPKAVPTVTSSSPSHPKPPALRMPLLSQHEKPPGTCSAAAPAASQVKPLLKSRLSTLLRSSQWLKLPALCKSVSRARTGCAALHLN